MNRFIDAAKSLKHGRESPTACPRCGSLNLTQFTSMDGWMTPSMYVCKECGYAGRVTLEVDRDYLVCEDPALKDDRDDNVPSTER